jgi:cell wall-associated NlpC family hydrolase
MAGPLMRAGQGRPCAAVRHARRFVLRAVLPALIVLPLLAAPAAFSPLPFGQPATALADEDRAGPILVRASGDPVGPVGDPETERSDPAEPTPEPEPPAPTAGEVIVWTALAYVGYPYAAGGNGPAGFDCSGFTQFVVLVALGIDIGHGLPGQTAAGWWVDWGAWQPGDLVFFANTYQPGLSHVGIYVGDGLFVHAGNQATGVLVSSVYEAYYASRYYGAVRIA